MATLATASLTKRGAGEFIRANHSGFTLERKRYPVIGANMWYAAYLGADRSYGNRPRLRRELDRLAGLGINNLRILGASEQSPLRGTVTPTFRGSTATYNTGLLEGLDWALAEIRRRGMRAVVYLNNFWEWSGGMAAYLTYVNGGRFVEAVDPGHPWTDFPDFVAEFYDNPQALALADDYVRSLVRRTNTVTGERYADDPAIMAWQLANEPRPGGTQTVADRRYPAFLRWVRKTSRLIKALDCNHLVSTGSEGTMGCLARERCTLEQNGGANIDYLTVHIWPQNFGWVTRGRLAQTYAVGARETDKYIDRHVALAKELGKPLVIEEFGFPRDAGSIAPHSATGLRDRYYRQVLNRAAFDMRNGGPLAGANFWAWSGEGRAQHPDKRFRPGDTAFLGDPPHEDQGLYGVFDTDLSTIAVIQQWASAMQAAVDRST